jgi:hypothetical protein
MFAVALIDRPLKWQWFKQTIKCEVTPMKCPKCGCEKFYVKDPDDEYETYEFECPDGEICFDPDVDESVAPVVEKETETYCNKCVWHDKFEKLQKQKG